MASISKLSLRGIRAFSPEDQEQVSLRMVSRAFELSFSSGLDGSDVY